VIQLISLPHASRDEINDVALGHYVAKSEAQ
jgi:hypothetical protein